MANKVLIQATPLKGGEPLIGSASELCTQLWGTPPSGYPRYISKVISTARDREVYRGYRLEVLPERKTYIMATPIEDGPPVIGTVSELCMELWGTVQSGYPKYIAKALRVARDSGEYRGYKLEVVTHKPIVLRTEEV